MNLEKLNQWLGLIGNLGVLVGIIFLVVEIQQNTEMTQAQTRDAMTEKQMSWYELVINDSELAENYLRQSQFPNDVRTGEQFQVEQVIRSQFRMWENEYYQYQQGLFEDNEFEPRLSLWRGIMSSPEYRRLWAMWRDDHATDFADQMDEFFKFQETNQPNQ